MNYGMIFIIIMIIITVFISYYIYFSYKFLDKKESYNFLSKNYDFYDRFTEKDLKVRNVKTIKEYIENIKDQVYNFSFYDKIRLIECCIRADNIIKTKMYPWFDGEKASRINWIFSCTGQYYEKGFPHTVLGKIIVLPRRILDKYDNRELIRTLIHEKVHIYQYKYKDDVDKYIKMNNFQIYKERELEDNTRVNPDTNNYIYRKGDIYYKAEFIDDAKTLNDIRVYENRYEYEHPFEEMAIEISTDIEK